MSTDVRPLLTINELADRLQLHHTTVRRAVHAGRIPATKLGGSWRIPTSYLDQVERAAYDRTAPTHVAVATAQAAAEVRQTLRDDLAEQSARRLAESNTMLAEALNRVKR